MTTYAAPTQVTSINTFGYHEPYGALAADPFGVTTDRFKEYGREHALVSPKTTGQHYVPRTLIRNFVYAHKLPQAGTIEYYRVLESPEFSADIAPETPSEPPRFGISSAVRDILITLYFKTLNAEVRGDATWPLWLVDDNVWHGVWISQRETDISATISRYRQTLTQKMASDNSASLCDCLDTLKDLKDGWDSYSAPAPGLVAIENAKALVKEALPLGTAPERVEPSAIGGVGLTFAFGHRQVVIEFYNKGTAHALFSDDATGDMGTQPVPTNREGYRGVIGEVRNYLYGK